MTCSLLFVLGNDPLADDENNHDINSVAGVLKLYFRGLENPLFPKERFNELLSCISKNIFLCIISQSLFMSDCLFSVTSFIYLHTYFKYFALQ